MGLSHECVHVNVPRRASTDLEEISQYGMNAACNVCVSVDSLCSKRFVKITYLEREYSYLEETEAKCHRVQAPRFSVAEIS